MYKCDWMFE